MSRVEISGLDYIDVLLASSNRAIEPTSGGKEKQSNDGGGYIAAIPIVDTPSRITNASKKR